MSSVHVSGIRSSSAIGSQQGPVLLLTGWAPGVLRGTESEAAQGEWGVKYMIGIWVGRQVVDSFVLLVSMAFSFQLYSFYMYLICI